MSNTYNKSYASLHTVRHDTTVLDAQKILVKTPENSITSRTDLIEYIQGENNKAITLTNELSDKLSPYSEEQLYESPNGESGIDGASILVIPANIFDSSTIFTQIILGGEFDRQSYDGPLYLGVLFCDSNGNKSIVGVSERYELKLGDSKIRFKFNKNPFIVPSDTRIILYFLKASEDLALEYPDYSGSRPSYKCSGANSSLYDPFDSTGANWQRAQSDIDLGFYLQGGWSIYNAYAAWPAITLAVDPHHSNPSHLTVEQYKKLENLNLDEPIPTYEKINELINNSLLIEGSTFVERFERPTGDSNQGNVNAFNLGADTIPHNVEINSLQFYIINESSAKTYLWLFEDDGSSKKLIGRSKNGNTWDANTTVTWYFDTFIIPDGKRLEIYFAKEDQTPASNEIANPGFNVRLPMVSGDKDTSRFNSNWGSRNLHVYLSFGYKSFTSYKDSIEQNEADIANLESEHQQIDNSLTELREYIESVEESITNNTIAEDINESLFGTYVEHVDSSTSTFEWDAAAIPAAQVPQGVITSIEVDAIDPISCELYLGVMCSSSPKPRFAVSTNSFPSGSSGKLKWEFDGFTPHEGHNLEVWLLNSSQISNFLTGSGDPSHPGSYVKTIGHNGGTHRYDGWWPTGNIKCTFKLFGELDNYVHKDKNSIIIENLLSRIEQLEQRITELEERGTYRLRRS